MYESGWPARVTPVVWVLALLVGVWGGMGARAGASVQPEEEARGGIYLVDVPDTHAGRQLRWAIDTLSDDAPVEEGEVVARFSEEFRAQVPPLVFVRIVAQVRAQMFSGGRVELRSFDGEPAEDRLVAVAAARGSDPVRIFVETDPGTGVMTGLLMQPAPDLALPETKTWDDFDALLSVVPGRVSFAAMELVSNDVDPAVGQRVPSLALRGVHGFGHQDRLAIGSTFKLWVLVALMEEIRSGEASWDDMIAIRDELKSLPSGDMQGLGAGEERTLLQFATKMISISDNTATDHLIAHLGRERVERAMLRLHGAPELNRPFLTTKEMFQIKLSGDDELVSAWGAASEDERRAMLAPGGRVASREPSLALAAFWTKPRGINEAEWFASAFECCRAMAELRTIELSMPEGAARDGLSQVLRTNPGMAFDAEAWRSVGYKGGSEPGVLSLTWLLERNDGRWFCLSLGVNDVEANPRLDSVLALASRAAGLLARTE